jgi:AraC-like DNA-binding protein
MAVWFLQIMYYVLPEIYAAFHSCMVLTCLLIYVLSYRFVFEITKVDSSEKFSYIHYLTPFSGFAVMLVWSFFVPKEVQATLVRSGWAASHPWFSLFFESALPLMLCMNVVYSLFGLRRIMRYRKAVVDYSADEFRGSLLWLYHFIYSMLAMFAGYSSIYIVTKIMQPNAWIYIIPSLIAVFKYVVLVHNILLENFVIIQTDSGSSVQSPNHMDISLEGNESCQSRNEKTTWAIKRLESYIRKEKPYLNTKYKITDMSRDLNTNRTSLSVLINRTYGVNFCSFINRYRLHELNRIKSNPANKGLSEEELVNQAGFSDYRGYLRVKFHQEMRS